MWLQMKSLYHSHLNFASHITLPTHRGLQVLFQGSDPPLLSAGVLWGRWHPINSNQSRQPLDLAGSRLPVCLDHSCFKLLTAPLPDPQCSPCIEQAPLSEFYSLKWPHSKVIWVIMCQALFCWHKVARFRGQKKLEPLSVSSIYGPISSHPISESAPAVPPCSFPSFTDICVPPPMLIEFHS